ncbi:MAG: DEAD/DEAH box helicase, partial [Acidimicrobiia bacterium]|nr:DEAD/DEAH box helicase [Acidimicrobiia bacterium]
RGPRRDGDRRGGGGRGPRRDGDRRGGGGQGGPRRGGGHRRQARSFGDHLDN